ncbi:multidrug resistance efflux transporter family protein [Allorhizobium undicola]|uniref:multidrug resistance efflux transporter family protein n=1 Tax=Allorhizobium undicola TaxID=78527 RepID=UPI000AB34A8C|nr:multidrug resistance efflux transporter family protein [Allorhizobium undicola]
MSSATPISTPDTLSGSQPHMPRLIGLGLLAAALFSVTFVLNRALSLSGGHWAWNAALRYLFMVPLLTGWIVFRGGFGRLGAALRLFRHRLAFWLMAGGVGFGLFYTGICFAADHAPGWIIAASWQATILATPLVLRAFGDKVPLSGLLFMLLIFLGIIIINAGQIMQGISPETVLYGVLPVLGAAFAYPVGNQLLSRIKHEARDEEAALLRDPAVGVLLLTLGALPVFGLLLALTAPPLPGAQQLIGTALVAVVAGGFATTLFLYARNLSRDPLHIAAVDATQAGEVGFALLGEMLFLHAAMPDLYGVIGLCAVLCGLLGFTLHRPKRR